MNFLGQMHWKQNIKKWGLELGFVALGFSSARPIEGLAALLQARLSQGVEIPWLSAELMLRVDPRAGWPACRTVVALAYPLPLSSPPREGEGVMARSAVGEDYHSFVTRKIRTLVEIMAVNGWSGASRWHVDSGPLNERALALRAGIGWVGRNQQLIIPGCGSFVALALLLLDQELEPDQPALWRGGCGACQSCVEACPAQILGQELFAARDCVSYLTQSKDPLKVEECERLGLRVFGCDVCQEVCPHNRQIIEQERTASFSLRRGVDLFALLNLSKGEFQERFKHTAAGWRGKSVLQRNAFLAAGNSQDERGKLWLAERQKEQRVPPLIVPYLNYKKKVLSDRD